MSLTFRLILAFFASIFGLMMAAWAHTADEHWFGGYLFAAFCFSIGIACFLRGRLAHFFGGLIATGVIVAGVGYVVSTLTDGPIFTASRSGTSVINAVLFCVVFGLPATKYLWATRFGFVDPPKPLSERLIIEFDDLRVQVRVMEGQAGDWNQQFDWADVVRVCFQDAGLENSDLLFIEVRGRELPVVIPTEARGGTVLFGRICERGLLPEHIWRKAMAEVEGGIHCWPPRDEVPTR